MDWSVTLCCKNKTLDTIEPWWVGTHFCAASLCVMKNSQSKEERFSKCQYWLKECFITVYLKSNMSLPYYSKHLSATLFSSYGKCCIRESSLAMPMPAGTKGLYLPIDRVLFNRLNCSTWDQWETCFKIYMCNAVLLGEINTAWIFHC